MSSDTPQAYDDAVDGDTGVTDALRAVFTAPLLAIAGGLATLIGTAFDSIGEVVQSLAALRDFITTFIADAPGEILQTGAAETSAELSEFGVAAFIVGALVIAGAWAAWSMIDPDIPLLDNLLPWR